MNRLASTLRIAALCTVGLTSSAYANLFGTEWRSSTGAVSLYNIDTTTRTVTRIGAVGATTAPRLIGLVTDTDGSAYAISEEPNSRLFKIDTTNGVGTPLGSTGLNLQEGDMTINPATGQIYLAQAAGDQLYTINKTTGAATLVGPFGTPGRDISGMQFLGSALYGLALNDSLADQLVTINPATGSATVVGLTGTNFGAIAAMGRDPANNTVFIAGPTTQFGNENMLYSLNLTTGAATLSGALPGFDFSVSGFSVAGDPPNLPEPAAIGVLAVGAFALSRRSRR